MASKYGVLDDYHPSKSTTQVSRWDLLLKFDSQEQRVVVGGVLPALYWIGPVDSLDWLAGRWLVKRSAHVYCVRRRDPLSGMNIIWQCSSRYSTFITHHHRCCTPPTKNRMRTCASLVSASQKLDSDQWWSSQLVIDRSCSVIELSGHCEKTLSPWPHQLVSAL